VNVTWPLKGTKASAGNVHTHVLVRNKKISLNLGESWMGVGAI
jgi:hypothetical protein